MPINPIQREVMIRMADPKLNVSVQPSSFPSESKHRVDEAIRQLYLDGYIVAVQSKDEEGDWIAIDLTPKGKIYLEDVEGL